MKKCCPDCMTEKDIEQFGVDKSRKDGIYLRCKVCTNKRLSHYRKNGAVVSAYDLNLMTNFLRACNKPKPKPVSSFDAEMMRNFLVKA